MTVAACSALLLGACDEELGAGLAVRNATASTLTLRYETREARAIDLHVTVAPGEVAVALGAGDLGRNSTDSIVGANGCTTGTLIAVRSDGGEVARHGPGLCINDTWVVGSIPTASRP